ncbi:hypothetical protein GWK47_034504 [Chionoecetes opilio]|uniref:Uncharacterized protein n=1 Tax=Chionoecetes opilio TaxID=41210 RepID=A0A8J4YUT0_CHIOP|nr:hypothetical protein GWK47_034504 [Chionoecetes opilio]
MMAAGKPKQASSESCSIRMQHPCTMPSVRSRGCRTQKAMILSLSQLCPPLQTTAATFCQSESELRDPKTELCVISPVRRTAMRHVSPERAGRSFPSQLQDQPPGIPGSAVSRYLGGFLLSRNSCSMDRMLFETAILPMVHSKNLRVSCER